MSNSKINISEILQISFIGLSSVAFTFIGCKLLISAALEFTNTHSIVFIIMFLAALCTIYEAKY